MATFTITYEIVTEESAEHGEAEERGFIAIDVSLRDAIAMVNETRTNRVDGVECDEWPIRSPRCITVYNGMEYETGARESRSLHIPEHVTTESRIRICRLMGINP